MTLYGSYFLQAKKISPTRKTCHNGHNTITNLDDGVAAYVLLPTKNRNEGWYLARQLENCSCQSNSVCLDVKN